LGLRPAPFWSPVTKIADQLGKLWCSAVYRTVAPAASE
jgi:hypothetical protein